MADVDSAGYAQEGDLSYFSSKVKAAATLNQMGVS